MNINGELTKTDDGAYAGWIASLTFDVDVSLTENPYKSKDSHPDLQLIARTPRGRSIRIGSAWTRTSKAGNDILPLSINVNGVSINANAIRDAETGVYSLKEWAD